ncbi:MAG TPA: hypothetical protein VGF24_33125 [Vicinamibacterales bacterium]|jgi:hypothetical protein
MTEPTEPTTNLAQDQIIAQQREVIAEQADVIAAQRALIRNQSADLQTTRGLVEHTLNELAAARAAHDTTKDAIGIITKEAA